MIEFVKSHGPSVHVELNDRVLTSELCPIVLQHLVELGTTKGRKLAAYRLLRGYTGLGIGCVRMIYDKIEREGI